MPDILLEGCTSRPLASCLKALGILRLVGEQQDAQVRGAWRNGCFVLSSSLDKETLCDFFLHVWQPTPLVSPWNGGSGFYPGDNTEGIDAITQSTDPRLAGYRAVIARIRDWPEFRMLASLPAGQARKQRDSVREECKNIFLQRCRAELPEACLPWLDAAFILREDRAVFAPLLGTGGNEGRLEYANNFMQHVSAVFSSLDSPQARGWLESALFAVPTPGLPKVAAGQLDPALFLRKRSILPDAASPDKGPAHLFRNRIKDPVFGTNPGRTVLLPYPSRHLRLSFRIQTHGKNILFLFVPIAAANQCDPFHVSSCQSVLCPDRFYFRSRSVFSHQRSTSWIFSSQYFH